MTLQNVIDVMIDNNSKSFITKVLFYVSTVTPTASGKMKRIIHSYIKEFNANLVGVFNQFCLKPKKQCPCQLKKVLHPLYNEIDCGMLQ